MNLAGRVGGRAWHTPGTSRGAPSLRSRRPIPMRAREIAQYAGLVMLGMLMVLAFRNDIARLLFC